MKVDALFTRVIELILRSGFTPRAQKTAMLTETSIALDSLKFFLQVLWEIKALERKTYEEIALPLVEIGKILGQWLKYASDKNAAPHTNMGTESGGAS